MTVDPDRGGSERDALSPAPSATDPVVIRRGGLPVLLARLAAVCSALGVTARYWSEPTRARIDFHIYAEAIASGAHSSLYDFHYRVLGLGFTYPPFASVVLWPLSVLPEAVAEHLWLLVGVAGAAAFLAVVGREVADRVCERLRSGVPEPDVPWKALITPDLVVPVVVTLGLWTMPVTLTARLGQVNALLAALIAIDIVLLRRRSPAAGLGIGLAAAVKLTPAILIPFLWLTGRRRAAMVSTAVAVAATAVAGVLRPSDTLRYFGTELWATNRVGALDSVFSNSLRRATSVLPGPWSSAAWLVLAVAVVLVAYRRAMKADRFGQLVVAVTIVMCASYLVSPISWGHHLYFLIPAVFLWVASASSPASWAMAAVAVVVLYDPFGGGELGWTSAMRIVVLLVMVVALPVDGDVRDLRGDPARPGRAPGS